MATEYEENKGIWPSIDTSNKLVVDFENNNLSLEIEKYFNELKSVDYEKYCELLKFLKKPISFFSRKVHEYKK